VSCPCQIKSGAGGTRSGGGAYYDRGLAWQGEGTGDAAQTDLKSQDGSTLQVDRKAEVEEFLNFLERDGYGSATSSGPPV
jgi:hypothetical protein